MRTSLLLFFTLMLVGAIHGQATTGEIYVVSIVRISDRTDEHGRASSPWRMVKIGDVAFKSSAKIGDKVTVIPLDVPLETFELEIIKAEKEDEPCSETPKPQWKVDFKPLTDRRFFDIPALRDRADEYPFNVAILFPAVPAARQIPRTALTPAMIPRGVTAASVQAAIDLTNDGAPDLVITEFCCDDPRRRVESCDYTCSNTYVKTGGIWKTVKESRPC